MFVFSTSNEEFVRLLNLVGKGIRENNQSLIEEAKVEYAKYNTQLGFKDDTQEIVLIAEGAKPCFFKLSEYDGVQDAEIVTE